MPQQDTTTAARIAEHTVAVPQSQLTDLVRRLDATRYPEVPADAPQHGVPLATVRSYVDRWRQGFDWAAVEARINRFPQVLRHDPDGSRLFAVHLRGDGHGLPVLLLHGWADTFYSQLGVAERLAGAGHDVVVPSLPGFAFSDPLPGPATAAASAAVVHTLMADLGYDRYAVHGGDWGGVVAHALMTEHPEAVRAAHLTDVPFPLHFATERDALEPDERAFLDAGDTRLEEPQYYRVQAGKPLTLAYGMADSPVAQLSWLLGLYTAWTDREPDADAVLATVSLYWLTNSFHSSIRFYSEGVEFGDEAEEADAGEETAWGDDGGSWAPEVPAVPTAFAVRPADIVVPTRAYAERYLTVERFTLMDTGGHFAAMEDPAPLAADIVSFLAGRG